MTPVIYHNPNCGTSRNTLELIRQSGIEPEVIEYLKNPPDRETLLSLLDEMGITPRQLLRQRGTPFDKLGLNDPHLSDDHIIERMIEHPILIQRPIVRTTKGTRLCRPAETVMEIL